MYKVIKYPKHQMVKSRKRYQNGECTYIALLKDPNFQMVKSRKRYQNGECTYQEVHELERPEFSKNAGI